MVTKKQPAGRKPAPGEKLGDFMGVTQHAPRKLDIACGQNKQEGYTGIDIAGNADIVHDLFKTPWPIKTSAVQQATSIHFVEHIPHRLDDHPGVDGWFVFFDELHRVMKKNGEVTLVHPYVWNDRAFWDPTHVRFIHEMNYHYLNKAWREEQGLDHYPTTSNFELVTISFNYATDDLANRPQAYQEHARTHWKNAVSDLTILLKALK